MKSIFSISLILGFLLPNFVSSQTSMGFRVGYTSSTWVSKSSTNSHTMGRLSGLTIGVPFEFKISNLFSIQPELNYISKGGHDITDARIFGINIIEEQIVQINYLEVPALAKFSFRNGKARLDVLLGPAFGYALDGFLKTTVNVNGQKESEREAIDFKDDEVNRADISLNLGIGVSLPVGMNRAFFDFRYQAGLSNIAAPANNGATDDFTVRDNTIQLAIGMMFPLNTIQKGAIPPKQKK